MNNIRVVLLEDDDALRESLTEILNLSGISTDSAENAITFYQLINTSHFDVAIIDIGLPDQSGLKVAEFLRQKTAMGIILLTAKSAIEDRIEGYHCGADHFFVKPANTQELIAAIQALYTRLTETQSLASQAPGRWCLDKTAWQLICPDGSEIKMTAKEMLFMETLMREPGKHIARKDLMHRLSYPMNEYGSRSMDAMLRRLRKKAEMSLDKSIPIQTIRTVGYCFSSSATILNDH